MGLFKYDRRAKCVTLGAFIVLLSWTPHISAKYSHSDCDDEKIRSNIVRVCQAYPTLKRSTAALHEGLPFPTNQEQYYSPDSVLNNFPRATDDNSDIASYIMPILSNPNTFRQVNAMAPIPQTQPAFGPATAPLLFPQNVYNPIPPVVQQQNSFSNGNTQLHSSHVQAQNNAPATYFSNPYNIHNLIPWLGNAEMYTMNPIVRWRRDETMKEIQNFVGQCCAKEGCPFPTAYLALDKKINLCKRR